MARIGSAALIKVPPPSLSSRPLGRLNSLRSVAFGLKRAVSRGGQLFLNLQLFLGCGFAGRRQNFQ